MLFCCKIIFCNLRTFVEKSVLSWFTHFCVEKNLSRNYGEKNDKYEVWLWVVKQHTFPNYVCHRQTVDKIAKLTTKVNTGGSLPHLTKELILFFPKQKFLKPSLSLHFWFFYLSAITLVSRSSGQKPYTVDWQPREKRCQQVEWKWKFYICLKSSL